MNYYCMILYLLMGELWMGDDNTMMMALEEEEVRLLILETLTLLWWIIPNVVDSIEVYVLWLMYDVGI